MVKIMAGRKIFDFNNSTITMVLLYLWAINNININRTSDDDGSTFTSS